MTTLYAQPAPCEKCASPSIIEVSMHQKLNERVVDLNPQETAEWVESLDQVIDQAGPDRATFLLEHLNERARANGVEVPVQFNTPYINTIRPEEEAAYPGDREMERRIKSLIRWNAMAMVVAPEQVRCRHRRPHLHLRLAGHALRSGLQPFLPRRRYGDQPGDLVYFQGHASPGVYAPRLPRRPPDRRAPGEFPSRTARHARACPPIRTRG